MWIRFKKRNRTGHTKYHWFDIDNSRSICGKEIKRETQYGKPRITHPGRACVCSGCHIGLIKQVTDVSKGL